LECGSHAAAFKAQAWLAHSKAFGRRGQGWWGLIYRGVPISYFVYYICISTKAVCHLIVIPETAEIQEGFKDISGFRPSPE
jgi:hypothetical protein